ncbi:MAG TPA: class I SAM-dependent methyltransferase, partial [Candidatus Sumerlaeota bacterium]|nr:class I SAM-dependent methyltransferase [Candidatus Sumerlaeota bacterium]HPK01940.1 class I SAM-dependent methyltransferase [Candidatus Sumerlaeota bacterium]
MCIACATSPLDAARKDAFGDALLAMLNGGMTCLMISLGHRAGLFDAMADGEPRTLAMLVDQTGLNERYVREWLGAMVAARIIERDPQTGMHRLPPEHAHWLSRNNPTGNMAVFAQYLAVLGSVEDDVLECFRRGGGVPYAAFKRFHDVMAEDSGQAIVQTIVDQVVPRMPGLHERLQAGIDVLDVGCGRGLAMMQLAAAYPRSRFTGYDLSEAAVAEARRVAAERGLSNIRFEQRDLTDWDEPASYDWITALDAIHDQARPDKVLAAIRRALRPAGVFLMMDIDASSEPVDNIDHPLGAMIYAISCMHCMTVSLAQGGMGLGAAWGVQLAERMLREAGFESVRIERMAHDFQNAYFTMET